MTAEGYRRKLTAILSADVKGYSRLMGEDEEATISTLTAYREVMASLIRKHRGRVVDSPGDNVLAEFKSVVDAVRCAVEIQEELKARNAEVPENRKMEFRIGVNLGDVIEEQERIYGDGVNIAARVEGLAEGGGISISGTVHDHIENKLALSYESLGEHSVKNIKKPVRVYRVLMEPGAGAAVGRKKRRGMRRRQWAALAVLGVLFVGAIAVVIWKAYLRPAPPVEEFAVEPIRSLELPDKPSIAVLPFTNMSKDPEQEYFADGMTDDLITDLSKISGLFVIARNSVFMYKGKLVKVDQIGRELGVRYVLEGSVRRAGEKVRINAQLIDATTGGHLWAERYDRDLKDIFAMQDEVIQKIVAALAVNLTEDEEDQLGYEETHNLEAYDHIKRGWWHYHRFTREANDQARLMFERAIDLEPDFAEAYAGLGFTYYEEWAQQWSQDPQSLERASELAKKAIALNDALSGAHTLLSHVYLWRKQYEQAIAEQERAIALDPNNANGYRDLGEVLIYVGRPEEAIGLVEKAMRLDPHYPATYPFTLGFAYSLLQRYEEALVAQKRALARNPDFLGSHLALAATYIALDRKEEAHNHVVEVLRLSPQISLDALRERLPVKDRAELESLLEALREAGLPD